MTPESGAAELLALEFQPPHTASCLWLWSGSSGIRFLRGCKSCLYLGGVPGLLPDSRTTVAYLATLSA